MFSVQQGLGLPPDTVAVPVELHLGDPLDGFPPALFPDAVVLLRSDQLLLVHQLLQDVHGDASVRVPLRIGVPVGVGEDLGLVERQHLRDELSLDFDPGRDVDVGQ